MKIRGRRLAIAGAIFCAAPACAAAPLVTTDPTFVTTRNTTSGTFAGSTTSVFFNNQGQSATIVYPAGYTIPFSFSSGYLQENVVGSTLFVGTFSTPTFSYPASVNIHFSGTVLGLILTTGTDDGVINYTFNGLSGSFNPTTSGNFIGFDTGSSKSQVDVTLSSAGGFAIAGFQTAVPEAATWAMMMVGLGVVGGSLRRRQKVSTRVNFA